MECLKADSYSKYFAKQLSKRHSCKDIDFEQQGSLKYFSN